MIFCDYCDFFVGTIIHITLDTSLPFGRPLSVRFAHQRLCSQKLRISCCFKATLRHSDTPPLLPFASLSRCRRSRCFTNSSNVKRWIPTRHETMASVRVGIDTYDVHWKTLGILWKFWSKKNPDLVSKSQVLQIGSHLY